MKRVKGVRIEALEETCSGRCTHKIKLCNKSESKQSNNCSLFRRSEHEKSFSSVVSSLVSQIELKF